MLQDPGTERAPTKSKSGRTNHLWIALRRRAPVHAHSHTRTAFHQACAGLWAWSVYEYPGIVKGMVSVLRHRAKSETIRDWRKGRRKPPKWAWLLIATEAEKRAQALLHVAEMAKKEASD